MKKEKFKKSSYMTIISIAKTIKQKRKPTHSLYPHQISI